ncbi:MAG: stage V sporulation protein AD [Acetobacter sp.]|nr:stage V sporulation protein AD [Bacteroides sp.]MCM1340298.1 stage V sporulation protein AD [Acetobacter sp.]MCM1432752.1 stage V sporulation protein AD [Clostridiales bacterium]
MHKKGKTMIFDTPPVITGHAGVVGKKEGEGPLAKNFDAIFEDTSMGQQSYELAESAMLHDAIIRAMASASKSPSEVDYILSGDLLDQCMGSAFALKDLNISSIGLFGACSTMALSLSVGSMLVDSGADCIVAGTSSHFCSSERQFRFPLEYGGQRPPTAQWTVTGAGSAVVEKSKNAENEIKVKAAHIGKIVDYGITDANNMGAAMAPACADTLYSFFMDTGTKPADFDMILTGDLGFTGSNLLYEILKKEHSIDIKNNHKDCGLMIFDLAEQDVNSGGSGCGCSASVLCSHILKQMEQGKLKKLLFVATGALMSPTSSKQGNSIPGIAHAVWLEV